MNKIKVGVVGVGGISTIAHLPALKNNPDVEVVALCDLEPERMDKGDEILGKKTQHFVNYNELFRSGVEAVHICLPNYLHSEVAVAALEVGLNVFCEKPDAVSVKEVLRMQAAAQKSGKTLMVMRNNRHNLPSKLAKDYIANGEVGEIYCGRCGWIRRRGIPGKGGWFTNKQKSGGGPLIDLGVHMIDLAIYLMGNPTPVSVSGCTYTKFADSESGENNYTVFGSQQSEGIFDVEDLAMGFIRFDGGQCLQVECSWASNIEFERNFVELRGTKAGISIANDEFKLFTERSGQLIDYQKQAVANVGHANNIAHFYDVLLGRDQPDFVPQQGVNMIKILEAMYQSAWEGREIVL